MYHFEKTVLEEGISCQYTLYRNGQQLRYADFLSFLKLKEEFRSFFVEVLSDVSFHAYHWETPPVSQSTTDRPFEFVVTNSPAIDLSPNPGPFRQYFGDAGAANAIAVFDNLGNDAKLIAPAPTGQDRNYAHIGTFTEEAPEGQQHELWQTVARVTQEQLSKRAVWLNTAGGGVAWLHVRLDSRPKYYRHHPYKEAP